MKIKDYAQVEERAIRRWRRRRLASLYFSNPMSRTPNLVKQAYDLCLRLDDANFRQVQWAALNDREALRTILLNSAKHMAKKDAERISRLFEEGR